MNLLKILSKVGGEVLSNVVPGGSAILGVVNEFLPEGSKLGANATGSDISNAISGLPPEHQATVLGKKFDVEETQIKESYSTIRAMLESDAKNPQTTRPYIAKHSFHVIAFTIIIAMSIWAVGVIKSDDEIVKAVVDGWPFILAVIAPLAVLLRAYFGVLSQEQQTKSNAANGHPVASGLMGIIGALKR